MNGVSHQFPGRLRLRLSQLKGAPLAAAQAAASLRRITGVLAVEASPATGSMLVTYRVDSVKESQLLAALQRTLADHGLREDRAAAPQPGHTAPGSGARIGAAIVEKFVERAALSLVAALL